MNRSAGRCFRVIECVVRDDRNYYYNYCNYYGQYNNGDFGARDEVVEAKKMASVVF